MLKRTKDVKAYRWKKGYIDQEWKYGEFDVYKIQGRGFTEGRVTETVSGGFITEFKSEVEMLLVL